jgi:hypothetical protein
MLRRRKDDRGSPKDNPYKGLRRMALAAVENGLAPPTSDHPDVSGVVVDIPAQGGYASVVALTDNTTSMYTSTGGGTIGAGEHAAVASIAQQLLVIVQAHLGSFKQRDDGSLPPTATVRFHVLTPSGNRRDDVPEDCFWGRAPHELMPVIAATQELITAIRGAAPQAR